MATAFHHFLRKAAQPIWDAIFSHPFIEELGAGTLSRARFLFFVRQDYLYLQDFARVLCLGGAKADSLDTLHMFTEHAATVVQVERNLHTSWSKKPGITAQVLDQAERAPVTQAYTRHLLAVAHSGTLAEIVAAVLPCYWIYWEVGKKLNVSTPNGHRPTAAKGLAHTSSSNLTLLTGSLKTVLRANRNSGRSTMCRAAGMNISFGNRRIGPKDGWSEAGKSPG